MNRALTKAEVNHLRRLIGYVRCEILQNPDELVATVQKIYPAIGEISEKGKQRLVESYEKAIAVPKYVRDAIRALEKVIIENQGEILDVNGVVRQNEEMSKALSLIASCNTSVRGDVVDIAQKTIAKVKGWEHG
jgi:hypothetical protein